MGTSVKRYAPSFPVVTARAALVPVFVSVTFAPATTAPDGSLIVPVICAVACCANARCQGTKTLSSTNKMRRALKRRVSGEGFMDVLAALKDVDANELG